MENITSINKNECCGCSACFSVCPKSAISMEKDSEGFLYPVVKNDVCVNCGICVKTCKNKNKKKYQPLIAYAAKNRSKDVLKKSSSGGVSHALCRRVIEKGGIVFAVSYSADMRVIISRAETLDECEKFYGSKYVQADPGETFGQVKEQLVLGRMVLVVATSCYVAGLLSFLDANHINLESLYTVDLICHGVPSPRVFSDYIKWINKNDRITKFEFRTKAKPWGYGSRNYGCTITSTTIVPDKAETLVDTPKARAFLNIFFSNNCLRPHCHQCVFAGEDKPADITIADYWGVQEEHPEFYSPMGVSAVIVHSEKGKCLLVDADELEIIETSVAKIRNKQGNMNKPSVQSPQRDEFWHDYNNQSFDFIAKKYGRYNFIGFVKQSSLYYRYVDWKKKH